MMETPGGRGAFPFFMELFQAIKERYSYRGAYVRKPVPEELIG